MIFNAIHFRGLCFSVVLFALSANATDITLTEADFVPGQVDDTEIIQTALLKVRATGGGNLYLPAGTFGITTLKLEFPTKDWKSVHLRGSGRTATKLKKIGDTDEPVIDWSSDAKVMTIYSSISDLMVIGKNKSGDCIRLTKVAYFVLNQLRLAGCDVGMNSRGALVFSAYDVSFASNNVGYKSRRYENASPNQVQFTGGSNSYNSQFAIDIGGASGVTFRGVDMERNGTRGDPSTGTIMIRESVDDESAHARISFYDTWLEANYGTIIKVEDAPGLKLSIYGMNIYSLKDGATAEIGSIKSLYLENLSMTGGKDEFITSAEKTVRVLSDFNKFTDKNERCGKSD
jgi:hypothetical protein